MDNVAGTKKQIETLEQQLVLPDNDITAINAELQSTMQHLNSVKAALQRSLTALGVEESRELKKFKKSVYLQDKMNARALKHRIRDRLRQRKFEFESLMHNYRQTITGKELVMCTCPCVLINGG